MERSLVSFIHNMTEFETYVNTLMHLLDTDKDQLIENLPEIEHILTCVEKISSISVGIDIKNIIRYYEMLVSNVKNRHGLLINKIMEREKNHVQFNSNGEFYDEGNLIMEIIVVEDEYQSTLVPNMMISSSIHMDQIVQPNDYSNIALVNRMKKDYMCIDALDQITKRFYITIMSKLNRVNESIRGTKDKLSNATEIEKICSGNGIDHSEFGWIKDVLASLLPLTDEITKLNTAYLELQHNYEIYYKAVDSYTSTVLENAFGSDCEI